MRYIFAWALSASVTFGAVAAQAAVNFRHVVGIELLVAEKSSKTFESRWGHVMLRLVDDNLDLFDDQIISFGASISGDQVNYARAASGGYPLQMHVTDMGDTIREYVIDQNRSLNRLVLPMSSAQREAFVRSVRYLESHSAYLGNYDFLQNNCVVGIVTLLKMSGFYVSREDVIDSQPSLFSLVLPTLTPVDLIQYLSVRGQTNLPSILEMVETSELPQFTNVPRCLYFTNGLQSKATYDNFVSTSFSKARFINFQQAFKRNYLILKSRLSVSRLINANLRFPRKLLFESENYRSNAALINAF